MLSKVEIETNQVLKIIKEFFILAKLETKFSTLDSVILLMYVKLFGELKWINGLI